MSQKKPSAPPARRAADAGRLPRGSWKLFLAGTLIIAVGCVCQWVWPHGFSLEGTATAGAVGSHSGPVRINELMSKNDSTLVDENGLTPDWIEVANTGTTAVDLYGYALARDAGDANVFRFPDLTLAAGECAVVFADSTPGESPDHAPFNLSAQGGTLLLFNRKGTEIDAVSFPAMSADVSYARAADGTWTMSAEPTPGRANTEESYRSLHAPAVDAGVEISEILASNSKYAPDESGQYHDYLELHNRSGAAVDLSGWFLSDDPARPVKWRVPDGFVLQPDEYRVIHASKLDRASAEAPHTNFGLSSGGESLVLSDARGQLVDSAQFGPSQTNVAWLRQADGTWTTGEPSPGEAD